MTQEISHKKIRQIIIINFVFLLIPITISAQTISQHGVAYQYNGKKERTPLGNVTISYETDKRTTISDEHDGTFILTLVGRKMGDRIGSVTIKKREMMVFNQHAVDEWSVRKDPLKLILCNTDEFERQKENLIEIGKREAKKKYERQKAELEEKLRDSKISQEDYETRLNDAYEALYRLQKEIEKISDELARIDQSELDNQMLEIIEQYERGDAEEAIQKLKALNLYGEFDQRKQHREKLQQQLSGTNDDLKLLVKQMRQAVPILKNSGEWEEAGIYLKCIANETSDYFDLIEYVRFCVGEMHLKEAETFIQKGLEILENENDHESEEWKLKFCLYRFSMGFIYVLTHRYEEGEKELIWGDSIFSRIKKDYVRDLHLEGPIKAMLAFLYTRLNRNDEAEKMYQEALVYAQKVKGTDFCAHFFSETINFNSVVTIKLALADLYFKTYRLEAAKQICHAVLADIESSGANDENAHQNQSYAYSILRDISAKTLNYKDAETYGRKTLQIIRKLYDIHASAYELSLLDALNTLANILINNNKYIESEQLLIEAQIIARKRTNAGLFESQSSLATTLNTFGMLYSATQRYSDAEGVLKEALTINENLAADNNQPHTSSLASSYGRLGVLYGQQQLWNQAEAMLLKAIPLQQQISDTTMDTNGYFLADLYYCLGFVYLATERWSESIAALQHALSIRCIFYEKDTTRFALSVAQAHEMLSVAYTMAKDWYKAKNNTIKAIELYKTPTKQTAQYRSNIAALTGNLSFMTLMSKNFIQAERYAREALAIDSTLLWIYKNLAASLLFQGKYADAEKICRQYKSELKEDFLDDFKEFSKAGVIPKEYKEDVERFREILNKD